MRDSEFTNKEMKRIYEFLERYVPESKMKARRELLSLLRYDRSIWKQRVSGAVKKMLSEIDNIGSNNF